VAIDFFGEQVRDAAEAERAVGGYLELARRLSEAPPTASVALDLSHVGQDVSAEFCLRQLERIVDALPAGRGLDVGAEDSGRIDASHQILVALARRRVPVQATLQANLRRSADDWPRLVEAGLERGGLAGPDSPRAGLPLWQSTRTTRSPAPTSQVRWLLGGRPARKRYVRSSGCSSPSRLLLPGWRGGPGAYTRRLDRVPSAAGISADDPPGAVGLATSCPVGALLLRARSDLFLASREEDPLVPLLLVVRDAVLLAPKAPVEKLSVAGRTVRDRVGLRIAHRDQLRRRAAGQQQPP
jgi:hypothetical protein